MRRSKTSLPILIALGLMGWAVSAGATAVDMDRLPLSNPFLCANCHTTTEPVAGNAVLNDFGQDYLNAGRLWTPDLARMDSDGDGCLNGAEIGDIDGNGVPDEGVSSESTSPGTDDCNAAAVNEEISWSALKSLFNDR